MKLLYCFSPIFISKRFSRNSVIQYKRRRSLLKNYRVLPSNQDENIYKKLNGPLEEIVPITPEKTSITIDILGEDTYPKLSEWRIRKIVQRARRVLPLPISLTTDDKLGYVWQQRFVKKLQKPSDNSIEKLQSQIPHFIKFMVENDPELFKQNFPELHKQHKELIEKLSLPVVDERKSLKAYFPFLEALKSADDARWEKLNELGEPQENRLLDEEYNNYLKHHDLIQYFATTLNSFDIRKEYKPEIEGWASQFWLR